MNKKDLDALLNQIKHIILNKPISDDLKSESEDIADLQEAIHYLSGCLSESNEFLRQLAIGNLDAKTPSRHNFLAGSLKELHSGLKHLTWQANQVAMGDYNQQVSFLGDFSGSFNQMIAQLSEREQKLKNQSTVLTETNSLMMSIMDGLSDWIIVTAKDDGEIIYANQSAKQLCYNADTEERLCGDSCKLIKHLKEYSATNSNTEHSVFEYHCKASSRNLQIKPFLIQWHDRLAYVFYILDITNEKEEREQIEELAYKDELTTLYNRRYCIGVLEDLLAENKKFSFCMIDLDNLKFANDTYGHAAGDEYLKSVSNEMVSLVRMTDTASRFGGDEFAMIFPYCPAETVEAKMETLNQKLKELDQPFPMSVSYGVVFVNGNEKTTSQDIMEKADEKMYVYKRLKKEVAQSCT